jgi:hypothetical protein
MTNLFGTGTVPRFTIANPDPGPGAFLSRGPGIRDLFRIQISDPEFEFPTRLKVKFGVGRLPVTTGNHEVVSFGNIKKRFKKNNFL